MLGSKLVCTFAARPGAYNAVQCIRWIHRFRNNRQLSFAPRPSGWRSTIAHAHCDCSRCKRDVWVTMHNMIFWCTKPHHTTFAWSRHTIMWRVRRFAGFRSCPAMFLARGEYTSFKRLVNRRTFAGDISCNKIRQRRFSRLYRDCSILQTV